MNAREWLFSCVLSTCDLPTLLPRCVGACSLVPSPQGSVVRCALSSHCETAGTDLAPGSRFQPSGMAALVVT